MGAGDLDGTMPPPPPLTAEEEALKRNTDCVYFLASPLTCKKGIDCEYRHSQVARINPKDCWYWLNGNCLNPKCAFRHPPLDGMIGASKPGTPSKAAASTSGHVSYPPVFHNSNKKSIPCYYFQIGSCLKGNMCTFVHGPTEVKRANPILQQVPRDSVSSQTLTSLSIGKFNQQNISAVKVVSPAESVSFTGGPVVKSDKFHANGAVSKHNVQLDTENSPKSHSSSLPVSNGNDPSRAPDHPSEDIDDSLQDDDDETDEFFPESSPGFDVIVDDDTKDPRYFQVEEKFGDTSVHERSLNPVSDYVHYNPSFNDAATMYDMGHYKEISECGRYSNLNANYGQEYNEASPERVGNRRPQSQRGEIHIDIDGSDLRHQLLKKRKLRYSRCAISPEWRVPYSRGGRYSEEHTSNSHREQGCPPREGTMSKRLEGRIVLPRGDTATNNGNSLSYGDIDREGSWGKSLPTRSSIHLGKLHDRLNFRKPNGEFSLEERAHASTSTEKDEDYLKIADPKRLSEVKGAIVSGSHRQRFINSGDHGILSFEEKKAKLGKPLGHHQEIESCSFEGPKSLSEILKKKREVILRSCMTSSNEDESEDRQIEAPETQVVEKGLTPTDGEENVSTRTLEMEEDLIPEQMEDPDFENYEEFDGEYDYEADDGGGGLKPEDFNDKKYVDDDDGGGDKFASQVRMQR